MSSGCIAVDDADNEWIVDKTVLDLNRAMRGAALAHLAGAGLNAAVID